MKRTPFLNAVFTVLHWILCWVLAYTGIFIQLHYSIATDRKESTMIGLRTVYRVNWICWLCGLLLLLTGLAAVWYFLLRKSLCFCLPLKKGWMVLWIAEAVLGILGIQFFSVMGSLVSRPFLKSSLEQKWTEYGVIFFPAFAALLTLVGGILTAAKQQESTSGEA